jgi:hypothetical protein
MSGKPPIPSSCHRIAARRFTGGQILRKLDKKWNKYDDLCNAALEKGTSQGDKEADKYNAKCDEISAKRNEIHIKIRDLIDEEDRRMDTFAANKALSLPKLKAGKTRRKRRFSQKSNGKRSRKASPPSTVRKFR